MEITLVKAAGPGDRAYLKGGDVARRGPMGGARMSHDRGAVTVGNEAPSGPADARQRYDHVIGNFPV